MTNDFGNGCGHESSVSMVLPEMKSKTNPVWVKLGASILFRGNLCAVLLLLIIAICSCRCFDAQSIWNSSSSAPDRKVEAAKALIPKEASLDDVKRILGPGWIWANYHGPSQDLYDAWEKYSRGSINLEDQPSNRATQAVVSTFIDYYFLEYPVTNGYVSIRFKKDNNKPPHFSYQDAEYMLTNIPNQRAPR